MSSTAFRTSRWLYSLLWRLLWNYIAHTESIWNESQTPISRKEIYSFVKVEVISAENIKWEFICYEHIGVNLFAYAVCATEITRARVRTRQQFCIRWIAIVKIIVYYSLLHMLCQWNETKRSVHSFSYNYSLKWFLSFAHRLSDDGVWTIGGLCNVRHIVHCTGSDLTFH